MINVYVETNYLLNIARKQEESLYSSKILELAKNKKINLKLPIYCIPESYMALQRRHEPFKTLKDTAAVVLNELTRSLDRSRLHKLTYEAYKNLPTEIVTIIQREVNQLDRAINEVLKSAKTLNCSYKIHKKGIVFRTALDIPHEMDSAAIAAIEEDIKTVKFSRDKVFITADKKMLTVELKKLLQQQKCINFSSFRKAYEFIENRINHR